VRAARSCPAVGAGYIEDMEPDTSTLTSERVRAEYAPLDREQWSAYFDAVSKAVEGRRVEIEIAGLDIGDQIEAEWVVLNGVTYDRKDDTLYVYAEDVEGDLDHAIPHPREILVDTGEGALQRMVVVDGEDRLHIIRLKEALSLPAPS